MGKLYVYGMRLRPFSIGCQPKEGFVERRDSSTAWYGKEYWDYIVYDRELTDKEIRQYELDYLGEEVSVE